jgi:serine/threonine protein kinase
VKVYEILEDSTNYYVVMELIEGGDLLGKLTADNAKEFT